jgi:hypothetical protein
VPDYDITKTLSTLRWKGLEAPPYEFVTFEYKNDLAARALPYVDGDMHDFTGRRSFPMRARLLFVNTLFSTIGKRLFPEYWGEWSQVLDGTPGELVHPILGSLKARIESVTGQVEARNQGGVVVDITWVETVEDPRVPNYLAILGGDPATLAAAADSAAAQFGIEVPPDLGYDSLLTGYQATVGLSFTLDPTAAIVLGSVLAAAGVMIDALDALQQPEALPAVDVVMAFWRSLTVQLELLRALARPVGTRVVTGSDITLDAFASSVGNTLQEVMGLNPQALLSPYVTRGSVLSYYLA